MNLSRKIILVVVSTFIALVFIVATTSDIILLKSFATLEHKVLKDSVSKVVNEIEESFPELDGSVKDYLELFRGNVFDRISNLTIHSFATHRIDFVACYHNSGEIISVRAADFHGRRITNLSLNQLKALEQAVHYYTGQVSSRPLHGYIDLDGAVAQIVMRPFDSTSVLMVGKFIDQEEVGRISALTKFVLEVRPYASSELPADFLKARTSFDDGLQFYSRPTDDDHISGYSLFRDIYGKPVLILKVTEPRLIYEQGKVSILYILLALVLSSAFLCVVMLFFIRSDVLERVATLSAKVGEISRRKDISVRLEVKGQDELESLAGSINSMLDSLESAESALKESEERYRALFERAPDSIIIIGVEGDDAGRIIAANQAAAAQHGYTVEELRSLKISDINTPETNLLAGDIMQRVVAGEWVTCELWHVKKDGSHFPIEVHAGPLKIRGRTYILGFDRDITSRKVAEESDRMYLEQISQLNKELALNAAELSMANKELESFNYSVSHDMRGPLTRISGYCQILLEEGVFVDSKSRTYLTRIYESSCWLDELLETMIRLSRLTRSDFKPENIDVSSMVENVVRELVQAEPDRPIEVHIQPGVEALGDAQLLKVLIDNLVNNSWKYSSGMERTFIEFGVDSSGPVPVYFVRDKGAGFDMKDADKLFRVFTRLHDPTRFSGSGIGLATAQRVIARHGGKIWAEGQVGQGATFYFTLEPESRPV